MKQLKYSCDICKKSKKPVKVLIKPDPSYDEKFYCENCSKNLKDIIPKYLVDFNKWQKSKRYNKK